MGNLFSSSFPFKKSFKDIMESLGIEDKDVNEDTFAQVFIDRIKKLNATNEEKIGLLRNLLIKIYAKIGYRTPSSVNNNGGKLNTMPKVSQEIKDLIMKKKDDYKKQIFAAIAELELPIAGGSRKKSKKLHS
jgi:hypothetical protein